MKHLRILLLLNLALTRVAATAGVTCPEDLPQAAFAARHIREALGRTGAPPGSVRLVLDAEHLGEQAYRINRDGGTITVTGGDARGVMYGGLELAERMRLQTVEDTEGAPFIKRRGIKMNIPLDARTPSYADCGDAALRNIPEMWNWDFWTAFLDAMALHRYNTLTLWNPHPFPVMTRIPGYEDVALPDVSVCTLDLRTQKGRWGPVQLVTRDVMDNLKVVKSMTIEDKITFWRKVMRYARDRGIDIYFITWNICPNSVAIPMSPDHKSWATERGQEAPGKYGVTHQIDDPATLAYYRAAVKNFILTYPDLKGLGVTAGENMPADTEGAEYTRERWLWEAYGLGILDAKREQPDRTVHFIHRVWYSDMGQIMKYWGRYPDPFDVSFKYAKARLYSSPNIPFAAPLLKNIEPYGLMSWWNLRNDDIFIHRWGDPDYVRDFLKNVPYDFTAGYHMGSDGYVWGREFVTKDAPSPAPLEIDKHWYRYLLWGRLGYDPTLDRDFFQDLLKERFPETDASVLYDTWQTASKIIPLVNRFHWRDWDFMWAVEGCKDGGGYHTVKDFYDNPTMEGQGLITARAYVEAERTGKTVAGTTPLEVADELDRLADRTLAGVASLPPSPTVLDCQAMALLGQFYADKIRATVAYGFFATSAEKNFRAQTIAHLEAGLTHWTGYTLLSESRYHTQVLARTGTLDWAQLRRAAADEIKMVREMP